MKIISLFRRIFTPGNIVLVVVITLLLLLFFNIVGIVRVSGSSMDPTLSDGQFLIGLQVNHIPFLDVSRGDIVTAVNHDDILIIKRVIALPGDRVTLRNDQLYINGELQYEPYLSEPIDDESLNNIPEFTVPEGKCFILGDNRNISKDSRMIGCVDLDSIRTLIPIHHQAIAGVALLAGILLVSWLACTCTNAVDLRWEAYMAAKKAYAEATAEPEEPTEEPEE